MSGPKVLTRGLSLSGRGPTQKMPLVRVFVPERTTGRLSVC
jgi:hypothetical protein